MKYLILFFLLSSCTQHKCEYFGVVTEPGICDGGGNCSAIFDNGKGTSQLWTAPYRGMKVEKCTGSGPAYYREIGDPIGIIE